MTLGPGTRLGAYEILSPIGAGGMGEVYRARDTRLDRTVALKILPAQLAADPEFRERFEREARAISQLTHPHICTLHDVGQHDGTAFLVLEHLAGETLAERVTKGPLPIEQTLQYALEIAAALEAAHRHGIVHRDLKPGNIMLTKSGVKLLDFGLAKVGIAAVASGAFTTEMQTVAPLTAQGTILGTVQYMAPEQIEGREADARADIWAFGCVLYEMIAGRPAFEGKTQVSVMGAILKEEPPPLSRVQPALPPVLGYLVRTCLAKDPDARFATAHDLLLQLKWIQEGDSAAGLPARGVVRSKRRDLAWAGIAVVALILGAAASAWWLEPAPTDAHVVTRFQYSLPEGQNFTRLGRHVLALSPDGTKLVYVANQQLYLREMNALNAQPIRGTAEDPMEPVFSPDGAWIAYFVPVGGVDTIGSRFTLKKVAVTGGAPVTLAQLAGAPFGASWDAGMILFGMNYEGAFGVQAVSEGGGPPRMLVAVDPTRERAALPQVLEDGRHVLFAVLPADGVSGEAQIVVQPIAGGARKILIAGGTDPRVLRTGHLIYSQSGTLLAVRFDATRLEVSGGPVPVAEGVYEWAVTDTGAAQFAIAPNGTLAFRPGGVDWLLKLVWVDRQGREEPLAVRPRPYLYPRLSPDGTKIAVSSVDEEADIWAVDLPKETLTRVTFSAAVEIGNVWTPDSRHLLFGSGAAIGPATPRDIYRRAADGTGTTGALTKDLAGGTPQSISPDGRWLLFRRGFHDLFLLPLQPGGQPRPLLAEAGHHELNGELSPDGRWIAYQSNESGHHEIYVRPFPNIDGGRWQVS